MFDIICCFTLPCESQSITLTSVTGTVAITIYIATDNPPLPTTYNFIVSQPICDVTSFSVDSSYVDPINCVSAHPADIYSSSSICITNSSSSLISLQYSSTDICYYPNFEFYNGSQWASCQENYCYLSSTYNYFRVTFDNSNNPSYFNVSNGLCFDALLYKLMYY